jgi:large subunit ribosomal protein L19
MNLNIFKKIEEKQMKKRPEVKVGDTVKVHIKIKEGEKFRIQIFEGVVISLDGSGLRRMMTVRKISYGVGVEKMFPINSPMIEKIEVVKRGKVRRSKLYYMKKRVGKRATKVKGIKDVYMTDEVEVEEPKEEVKAEETATEEVKTEDKKEEN